MWLVLVLLAGVQSVVLTDVTVTLSNPDENRFAPFAACDNRTVCLTKLDISLGIEVCDAYAEPTLVLSPYCINVAHWCENRRRKVGCWVPLYMMAASCDRARECYPDAPAFVGWSTNATAVATATTPITTTTAAGDGCRERASRLSIADDCTAYLECAGDRYTERRCYEGYIYYEPFRMCLPGNVVECKLF